MTTIKATCPTCGEVSLTPADIELHVDPTGAETASYAFRCPHCTDIVCKPADERVVRLLVSGGVQPHRAGEPVAETPRRTLAQRHAGPPLTPDDLIDFHALLERDDWFQQLLSTARES